MKAAILRRAGGAENFSIEEAKISNEEIKNEIVAKLHQFEALLK